MAIRNNPKGYKIGVYGARNVCSRVGNEGISTTSFVCDMSTGFSGNLGYPLPEDWAFDQIKEFTIGSGDGAIAIDNNICSNRDRGVDRLEGALIPPDPDEPTDPNEPPILNREEEKMVVDFVKTKGLFTDLPFSIDMQAFGDKILLFESLIPNYTIEGELALTAQLVGPYNQINFYQSGTTFTTHVFDEIGKGGFANDFDVDPNAVERTFNRLRVNDEFMSKYMKYYLELGIDQMILTLEVPLTIPTDQIFPYDVGYDNIVIYQRTYITFKKDRLNKWKIPAHVLADETEHEPGFQPDGTWIRALGYTGLTIIAASAILGAIPAGITLGATGVAAFLLLPTGDNNSKE